MPENVAFFLPHFGHGGAEGVVLRLLQGMDRSRFSPLLILQRRRGELLEHVPHDVPVLGLSNPRPPLCIAELARVYAQQGVVLAVTATNATNLYSIPAARLARSGVRTLATEHTPLSVFLAETGGPRLRKAAVRAVYPLADLTAGPLDDIGADLAAALGSAAPPFVTLPNPVVDRTLPPRSVPAEARRIVSVGRLAPEKRFDLLIEAFSNLNAHMPETTLTIHGEGSERLNLEALIRDAGLEDRAALPGYTSDLDAVHEKADVFVCTSRREGLGNAMIEAMARGVPVVSVDCPFGPRRLLRDGAAGHLVKDGDAAAVSRALSMVLRDAALRERYVREALHVAAEYQVDRAIAAYEAAFDRALSSSSASRTRGDAQ